MNVRCPGCSRVYRVNPSLVPAGGVRARCSCNTVLTIGGEATVREAPAEVTPTAFAGAAIPTAVPASATALVPEPAAAGAPPLAPAPPAATVTPAAQPADEPATSPTRPRFGAQDPDARARRIARALVSDMVVYNPERRDSALSAGTLRLEFKDEILKSWNEYVEQVGEETARGTAHFRNALNDLLAKGEKLF